jgi:hypothetical protein
VRKGLGRRSGEGREAGVLLGWHGALALDSAAACMRPPRRTLPTRPWRVAAARCGHGSV